MWWVAKEEHDPGPVPRHDEEEVRAGHPDPRPEVRQVLLEDLCSVRRADSEPDRVQKEHQW